MSDDPFEGMFAGQVKYFQTRLVKGGPFVPVSLWIRDGERDFETGELLSDQIYGATINGEEIRDFERIARSAVYWDAISASEFQYLTARSSWAQEHCKSDPLANPKQAIDLRQMPPAI